MVSNVVTDNSLCRVRHSLSLVEHSTGLENLGAMIDGAAQVGANTSPERVMQGWWDSEEESLGGHFHAAAKMSSRYVGCAWSQMAIPTRPGAVCRIVACRYRSQCGDLFQPRNTMCPMCPTEGC